MARPVDTVREFFGFGPSKWTEAQIMREEGIRAVQEGQAYAREAMTSMMAYSIALEDVGWLNVDKWDRDPKSGQLTFRALKAASAAARVLLTGNPIISRAAGAHDGYVWGQGFHIDGANRVISQPANRAKVFSEGAISEMAKSRKGDGNLFFEINGRLINMIPFNEIEGAIYDPQHPADILYFYRVWTTFTNDFTTGSSVPQINRALYPNMNYDRGGVANPPAIQGIAVNQQSVIYHAAVNRMVGEAWGKPDILAGIFYAGEHKELIEAADAIYRAQSQYATVYKSKTTKALANLAATIAGPMPMQPGAGADGFGREPYGQSLGFGDDIDMQLTQKIGAGLDFTNFDPIAGLASSVLDVPLDVVLNKETEMNLSLNTMLIMKKEQRWWADVFTDIFTYMGLSKATIYFPPINPDPAFRQIQSIVGAAATEMITKKETRGLIINAFEMDADPDAVPSDKEWEGYNVVAPAIGSTEPNPAQQTVPGAPGSKQTITPGQGQTGILGKLADGDHSLRDAGQQPHTSK